MLRLSADCFIFAEQSYSQTLDLLTVTETLRYRLAPERDRGVNVIGDFLFQTHVAGTSLLVGHPHRVKFVDIRNIADESKYGWEVTTGQNARLSEVYSENSLRFEHASPDTWAHFVRDSIGIGDPADVSARYIDRDVCKDREPSETSIIELPSTMRRSASEVFTVAKVGPFPEPGTYGARVCVEIDEKIMDSSAVGPRTYRIEGPGRIFEWLDRRLPQTEIPSPTTNVYQRYIFLPSARRYPRRYDVLLLNGQGEFPQYVQLTPDIRRIDVSNTAERILAFSCLDPGQRFSLELDFSEQLSIVKS